MVAVLRFAKGRPPSRGHGAALVRAPSACALGVLLALSCRTEEVRLGSVRGELDAGALPGAGAAGQGGYFPGLPAEGGAGQGSVSAPDAGPCVPVTCRGNTPLACGNCQDDDGDGWVDASDPECLGPCDDSEAELYSGVESPITGSCRTDCYFDRNAGSGDDGCSWSHRCDPGSLAPDYPPTGSAMCAFEPSLPACDPAALQGCQAGCLPLTPNGCDCFGCCELPAGSGQFLWLGSPGVGAAHCELATSDDPGACRPCTPEPGCQNRCDECELCVGKTELPAACSGVGGPACSAGVRSCDPRTGLGCGAAAYCVTGCCVPLPA